MAFSPNLLLPVTKVVTLVFGGLLTYLTSKAFRRTGSRSLRTLAAGFALLVSGSVLGGLLHEIGDLPLEASVTLQSMFTALAFAVLAYSLYTTDGRDQSPEAASGARQSVEHLRR